MPPVTPSAMSMALLVDVVQRDALDLPLPDFLHRQPRRFFAAVHPRGAPRLELLGAGARERHEFELVHTCSFPVNEPTIRATVGAITRGRARSASTIDRSRSTHVSNSSFTITYS